MNIKGHSNKSDSNEWPLEIVDELVTIIIESQPVKALNRRYVVAIAGPPAAGKSTLSKQLCKAINVKLKQISACVLPMDGFHMRNTELKQRNLLHLKGAPQTFDVELFITCLQAVRAGSVVSVPDYDRNVHDVVDDVIQFGKSISIAIVEGNYLLLNKEPWNELHNLFDLRIFIDASEEITEGRLYERHLASGNDCETAHRRVDEVDFNNHRLIEPSKRFADILISQDTGVKDLTK